MNTNKLFLAIALLICTLMSACEDNIEMLTTINPDGSCKRDITFAIDSSDYVNHPDTLNHILNVLNDDAWKKEYISTEEDSAARAFCNGKKKILVRASRLFDNVEAMNEVPIFHIANTPLRSKISLEKNFRWFYTEHRYEETFASLAGRFKIPLSKYMDPQSSSFYLTGTPNLFKGMSGYEMEMNLQQLGSQFYQWINANWYNNILSAIAENYESISNPPLSKEEFISKSQKFIEDMNVMSPEFNADTNVVHIDRYFGTSVYTDFMKANSPIISDPTELLFVAIETLHIDYTLQLPGRLQTNECSGAMLDEGLNVKLDAIKMLGGDYTIRAVSRETNLWAWALSIIGILCSLCCIFITFYHKH